MQSADHAKNLERCCALHIDLQRLINELCNPEEESSVSETDGLDGGPITVEICATERCYTLVQNR